MFLLKKFHCQGKIRLGLELKDNDCIFVIKQKGTINGNCKSNSINFIKMIFIKIKNGNLI